DRIAKSDSRAVFGDRASGGGRQEVPPGGSFGAAHCPRGSARDASSVPASTVGRERLDRQRIARGFPISGAGVVDTGAGAEVSARSMNYIHSVGEVGSLTGQVPALTCGPSMAVKSALRTGSLRIFVQYSSRTSASVSTGTLLGYKRSRPSW